MHKYLLAVGIAGALAVACGGPLTYKLASSPKATGADGTLEATIHKDEHETKLLFNVSHLPPAGRITQDAKYFIVWGRKDDKTTWQRIGNFVYAEDNRTGLFKASFPEIEFDIEVSVEKDDSVPAPSPDIVFSQHVGPA
jgi:hypothetical protein